MNTNGDTALDVLLGEIDAAICDVSASRGACDAHSSLSSALIVLLRCQRAQLRRSARSAKIAGIVAAIVSGIAYGIAYASARLFG